MSDTVQNNFEYIELTNFGKQNYAVPKFPTPTTDDYTAGFYIRYFVKQKNMMLTSRDGIIEIDKTQYNTLSKSSYYNAFSINWKLSGPADNIKAANTKIVDITDHQYPGFKEKMRPFILNA